MSVIIQGGQLRTILLGNRVQRATGTLTAATVPLFTISGGLVAVTSIVGRVTTAVTVANSYKLQHNPTAGTTVDIFAATDIGTTDTALGEIFVVTGLKTDTLVVGALSLSRDPIVMDVGQIEHVSAGTDGAILWALTYVPLEDGASVVAA